MDIIPKNLKPIKYRIYDEFQFGRDPELPRDDDFTMAGIPNVFHLYVTFDNGEEYKIVDYGFNLEPIPRIFPPYQENRADYKQMGKEQVMLLLKLIYNSEELEKIDLHMFNCLEKMIEISNLNYDRDVVNLFNLINMKSAQKLRRNLGDDAANELIELQNSVDHLEMLSTTALPSEKAYKEILGADNVIPFTQQNQPSRPVFEKTKDEATEWIKEVTTNSTSTNEENNNTSNLDNIISFKGK